MEHWITNIWLALDTLSFFFHFIILLISQQITKIICISNYSYIIHSFWQLSPFCCWIFTKWHNNTRQAEMMEMLSTSTNNNQQTEMKMNRKIWEKFQEEMKIVKISLFKMASLAWKIYINWHYFVISHLFIQFSFCYTTRKP